MVHPSRCAEVLELAEITNLQGAREGKFEYDSESEGERERGLGEARKFKKKRKEGSTIKQVKIVSSYAPKWWCRVRA